jgi:hypothetical protein
VEEPSRQVNENPTRSEPDDIGANTNPRSELKKGLLYLGPSSRRQTQAKEGNAAPTEENPASAQSFQLLTPMVCSLAHSDAP